VRNSGFTVPASAERITTVPVAIDLVSDAKIVKYRRTCFWALLCIYVASGAIIDYYNVLDETLFRYCIEFVALCTCAFLYVRWWIKVRRASEFYRCLTLLFLGMVVKVGMEIFARWIFVYGHGDYNYFITCYWWQLRGVPETLALIYMLSVIVSRLVNNVGGNMPRIYYGRRAGDEHE
jgi:hypothetical protein